MSQEGNAEPNASNAERSHIEAGASWKHRRHADAHVADQSRSHLVSDCCIYMIAFALAHHCQQLLLSRRHDEEKGSRETSHAIRLVPSVSIEEVRLLVAGSCEARDDWYHKESTVSCTEHLARAQHSAFTRATLCHAVAAQFDFITVHVPSLPPRAHACYTHAVLSLGCIASQSLVKTYIQESGRRNRVYVLR